MPIRQLAPDVAAKIAAGEVVERPASVVKELIENSIDAGATQIRVELMHGGLQLIRVTDNGCGIPPDELSLALARHATSKVAQIDDLEHISTLGFRGEALASLAAVADVTLISHARSMEYGAQISASNGELSEVTTAASPEGTTLTVRNLFSAVPARLKFLKSRTTEVSHCHHLLEQYALAYPEIRFSVYSDGRQIFSTNGDGQLYSVLVAVYGLQIADQMVPVGNIGGQFITPIDNVEGRFIAPDSNAGTIVPDSNTTDEHDEIEQVLTRPIVTGYTSRPTCYKSTRQYISFFVNRRWVLSRMLTAAVEGAYHSLLLAGRHPVAVINIEIDPSLLDVNVHPAKTEIRFLKERRVFAAILRAVREALLEEPEIPQWQPVAEPETTPDVDETTSDDVGNRFIDSTFQSDNAEPVNDAEPVNGRNELRPYEPDNPWLTVTEEEMGSKPPTSSRLWQSHIRPLKSDTPSPETPQRQEQQPSPVYIEQNPIVQEPITQSAQLVQSVQAIQSELAGVMGERVMDTKRRLPRLRVIGQLSQSYIVTEGEDGMYLIDQHAAHERILLERMVAAMKERAAFSQLLLTPIALVLAPNEIEALEEYREQLENLGFALDFEQGVEVRAVPTVLSKRMNAQSLHELLLELTSDEQLGSTETWEERALANVACKAAIKANYFLTVSEMREMIEQLEQTKAPYSCCHGRPTMVHFGMTALAREFDRR
ncbi:MAG TPA: DNA mismatch repair endonuclease MutL [Ktedonobacter sp.]|nr:DNA mismatch repair endonuclease MutL [Ktedonobacter sp.]